MNMKRWVGTRLKWWAIPQDQEILQLHDADQGHPGRFHPQGNRDNVWVNSMGC